MTDRHQFRAKWHDYNGGIYFVTICTHEKRHIFGSILNGEIKYSAIGKIVLACLRDIPKHHNNVEVWNHMVMPNHVHMILAIWQRNYHEHIIRNQHAFDNIAAYIDTNVENWEADCFNYNTK